MARVIVEPFLLQSSYYVMLVEEKVSLLLLNTPKWFNNIQIWWLCWPWLVHLHFHLHQNTLSPFFLCVFVYYHHNSSYMAPPSGYNVWTIGSTWSSRMVWYFLPGTCPSDIAAQTVDATVWVGKPLWGFSTQPVTVDSLESNACFTLSTGQDLHCWN